MYLSDEQMGAVRVGQDRTVSWETVELPLGPQPVPSWAKGLHVDFMDRYGNDPHYKLKSNTDLRKWEHKRFTREGARFIAVAPDGRAEVYYQDGALRPTPIKMWQAASGELLQQPRWRETKPGHVGPDLDGEWVEVERLCTPQEQGFGGSHIHITMTDGAEVVLRGPWHGGAPAGFVECAYIDWVGTRPRGRRPWIGNGPAWLRTTAIGGLFLREDAFIGIFARYAPHLRLMRLTEGGRSRVQAVKPEWDAPKCVILHRERMAREAERDARWEAREAQLAPIRALGFDPVEDARCREHRITFPAGGFLCFRLLEGSWFEYGAKGFGRRAEGKDLPSLMERLRVLSAEAVA